jgi:hypothetical protein
MEELQKENDFEDEKFAAQNFSSSAYFGTESTDRGA